MKWLELVYLIVKFFSVQWPELRARYERNRANEKYETAYKAIDATIAELSIAKGRDRLDKLKELER